MKKLFTSCFVVLMFSTLVYAEFVVLTIKERVKSSNLIVIGKLIDVSETETESLRVSKGTLVIEKVIDGNFLASSGQKLKTGDEIEVEWSNSKLMACQFGFAENEAEIWFLSVDREGKVEQLSPSTTALLAELTEVKNHLKSRKREDKIAGKIKLQSAAQEAAEPGLSNQSKEDTVRCLYSAETGQQKFYPASALLVILFSFSLYYFLYRSRFKIR